MKIYSEVPLSDCQFDVVLNDRSDIKQSLIRFGNDKGSYRHGPIATDNGVITTIDSDYGLCRSDIATITFRTNRDNPLPFSFPLFEAQLYADESYSNPIGINWSQDMTDADFEHFMSVIKSWFAANKYYVTKQQVWFKSKPWLYPIIKPGMIVSEAIKILQNLGW